MELSPKLDGVIASYVRDVIDKLHTRVRPLHLGPVKAPQFLRKDVERGNVDARKSSIERIRHACVESVLRRRNIVVLRKGGLVETVVPEAGFVHPASTRDPGPVFAEYLGAGVNLG